MRRALLVLAAAVVGCGDPKPPAVPTDSDSIKRMEAEQKKAARGEPAK